MMKILGNTTAFLFLFVLTGLWGGFALSVLWSWFVSPVFGLPEINLLQAIGLAIVVGFMTHQYKDSSEKEYGRVLIEAYLYAIVKPAAAIIVGWLWLQIL